jgi:hypothetical protein
VKAQRGRTKRALLDHRDEIAQMAELDSGERHA